MRSKRITLTTILTNIVKDKLGKKDYAYYMFLRKLMTEFFKRLTLGLIDGYIYKIPMRLGFLKISELTVKTKDWHLSKVLGFNVERKNYHTSGKVYKYHWVRANSYTIFQNKKMYSFRPTRANKRLLAQTLFNEYKEYTKFKWSTSQ